MKNVRLNKKIICLKGSLGIHYPHPVGDDTTLCGDAIDTDGGCSDDGSKPMVNVLSDTVTCVNCNLILNDIFSLISKV